MKRFNEMTKEELAGKTSEEVANLVELELAFAGIAIVPEPVYEAEEPVDIEPIQEAYSVRGIIFENKEDAMTFEGMSVLREEYNYNTTGSNYKWLESEHDYDRGLKTVRYFTKTQINSVYAKLSENKMVRERNSRIKKVYDEFVEKSTSVHDSVWEAYDDAKDFVRRVEGAKALYAKHLSLAGGDESVAERFFRDACSNMADGAEVLAVVLEK